MANQGYEPTPSVEPTGGTGARLSVQASPQAFGSQIGAATEKLGQTGEELGIHYAKMATEAKANDAIANEWAPQASDLRANFDQLQGQDKIQGYEPYIQSLQKARQDFVNSASSPYEKQIREGWTTRHIVQEVDGARREQVQAINQFGYQAHADLLETNARLAANNYNDPTATGKIANQSNALIEKHGIDNNQTPEEIDQQKSLFAGNMSQSMVNRALQSNDVITAKQIYADNKQDIPGPQRLQLETTLHSADIIQHSINSVESLSNGHPIPPKDGPTAQEARATTAQVAYNNNIDPSIALAVLRIESSDGQNLGTRGDIGQTGKGGDLHEQAQNMISALKSAKPIADNALGRESEPWEQYVVYQQGAGGGPALLKAAQDNPTAKAVDILAPLYKNSKDALAAVTNNGGNATMSSGQFLDFIKQHYNDNAQRAAVDIPEGQSPMQAMNAPHIGQGLAVQPAATPVQALNKFNEVYPDMLSKAQQIPNIEERNGVMRALEEKHKTYSMAAAAWNGQFQAKAQTLANDPNFTSIAQVPPEMMAAISDNPNTLHYLEVRADYNLKKNAGVTDHDMKEYGKGFYDLFKAIHAPDGSPDKINDITKLQSHVGPQGDITVAGYDKLVNEMSNKKTPEGEAESTMKKQFFAMAKSQISGADEGLHIKDPKGDELFLKFMAQAFPAIEKLKGEEHKSYAQIYNPDSPDYVGKLIPTFKRPMAQWIADMNQDVGGVNAENPRSLDDIIKDVRSGKIDSNAGKAEAIKLGLVRAEEEKPRVPMAE